MSRPHGSHRAPAESCHGPPPTERRTDVDLKPTSAFLRRRLLGRGEGDGGVKARLRGRHESGGCPRAATLASGIDRLHSYLSIKSGVNS